MIPRLNQPKSGLPVLSFLVVLNITLGCVFEGIFGNCVGLVLRYIAKKEIPPEIIVQKGEL